MLRLLLTLCALFTLTASVSISLQQQVSISRCPITYYTKKYENVYVDSNDNRIRICFRGPADSTDCIKGPVIDANSPIQFNTYQDGSLNDKIRKELGHLTNTLKCYSYFSFLSNKRLTTLKIYQFGIETALGLDYSDYQQPGTPSTEHPRYTSTLVNGKEVQTLTAVKPAQEYYVDITGCRPSGFGMARDTTKSVPEICTTYSCSLAAVGSSTTCGDREYCDGKGSCRQMEMCTVTGPTVIDFKEKINSVSDRCEYSLLHDQSTGFSLKANFLDRRRRDVSFVDSLTLDFSDSDDIQLLQGHRVMVAGSPVTLTSSVQTSGGVDLSKDQTGVTASISLQGSSVSVFFDGTTAQIYLDLPVNHTYEGLCVDSSSSSASKLSSNDSCQDQYEDPADDTTDCAAVTQQCDILKSAPFVSCNLDVDPEPYIVACRSTLCKYPSVDNLRCQFLKAYAKACEKEQVDLQSWWTTAQCHHPQPICGDKCIDHEFCGDIHGNTDCRCRAIYASQFTEQHRLGGPTVCKDNTASLSLVGCLLKENGIDYTHLHLNDKSCKGVMDPDSHMLEFTFQSDSCGTEVTTNNSQVIFTNAIVTRNSSSDVITRQDKVFIEFSCSHPKPELQNVAFNILDNSVKIFLQSGEWKYSVTMKAYSDAAHTDLLGPKSDVRLNQKIWIDLETEGLDEDVVSVVTEACWATSDDSPTSTPKYYLINDGCPNADDGTVNVMGNGEGTSNSFSFNMFEFSGKEPSEVYLHCQLQLCIKKNNNCVPDCSISLKRRRRSLRYRRGAPALISMVWTP